MTDAAEEDLDLDIALQEKEQAWREFQERRQTAKAAIGGAKEGAKAGAFLGPVGIIFGAIFGGLNELLTDALGTLIAGPPAKSIEEVRGDIAREKQRLATLQEIDLEKLNLAREELESYVKSRVLLMQLVELGIEGPKLDPEV